MSSIDEQQIRDVARRERVETEYSEALTRAHLAEQQRQAAERARRGPDPSIDARRAEQHAATAAARAKLAEVEAQRAKERAEALEQQLEPIKDQRRRAWLAEHPGQSAWTFDHTVWSLIRPEIVAAMQEATVAATVTTLKQSGRYDF